MKIDEFRKGIEKISADEAKKKEIWEKAKKNTERRYSGLFKTGIAAAIALCLFGMANFGTYVYAGESLVSIITRNWSSNSKKEFIQDDINIAGDTKTSGEYKYTVCDYVYDEAPQDVYFTVKVSRVDGKKIDEPYDSLQSLYYIKDDDNIREINIFDRRKHNDKTVIFGMYTDNSNGYSINWDREFVDGELFYYVSCLWNGKTDEKFNFCIIETDEATNKIYKEEMDIFFTIDSSNCKKCESLSLTYKNSDIIISPYCIRLITNESAKLDAETITIEYKDGTTSTYSDGDYYSTESGTEGRKTERKIHLSKVIDISEIKTIKINGETKFSC